jgi:hypothetical protein
MELLTDAAHMHPSVADFCKEIPTADSLVPVLKMLHSILAQNFQSIYYPKWHSVHVLLYDFCMHFLTAHCHIQLLTAYLLAQLLEVLHSMLIQNFLCYLK